jgi:hypothetical protein
MCIKPINPHMPATGSSAKLKNKRERSAHRERRLRCYHAHCRTKELSGAVKLIFSNSTQDGEAPQDLGA